MADLNPSDQAGTKKRRSTRIVQAIPISVSGTDALGQPFKERTSTVMVNCHGCKYQSKHYVPKHSLVVLEIPRSDAPTPHIVSARVIWVQRPRTLRELFQIGVEFDAAGNVWGIAFPPEDWGVEGARGSQAGADVTDRPTGPETSQARNSQTSGLSAVPSPVREARPETKLEIVAPKATYTPFSGRPFMADASVGTASPIQPTMSPAGSGFTGASALEPRGAAVISIPTTQDTPSATERGAEASPMKAAHTQGEDTSRAEARSDTPAGKGGGDQTAPRASEGAESQHAQHAQQPKAPVVIPAEVAREVDRLVSEARFSLHQVARHEGRSAVLEEIEATRAKVDAHLKEAVEQAVTSSMSRVSEQALQMVIQDSAFKAAAIIQDVRASTQNTAAELEAQLKQSLQLAIEESASRAAEQAVAQAAEKAITQNFRANVESALTDLLGTRPDLPEMLATEEAARARSEQLRRDIEEAGQQAREEQIAALERVSREASDKWQNELQTSLAQAQQTIAEASQAVSEQVKEGAAQVSQAGAEASRRAQEAAERAAELASLSAEQAAQRALQAATEAAGEAARKAASQIHEEVQARSTEAREALRNSLTEGSAQAREAVEAIRAAASEERARLDQQRARAQEEAARAAESQARTAEQLRATSEAALEQTRHAADVALQEARQRIEEVGTQRAAELSREAERLVAERAAHLEPALQESAQRILAKLSAEAQQQLAPYVESAQRLAASLATLRAETEQAQQSLEARLRETAEATLQNSGEAMRRLGGELDAARAQAEAAQKSLQSSLQEATEAAMRGAHERFNKQNEEYSARLDATLRGSMEKAEEQWAEKATEAQHSTFEALLKASDWYSKRAHTSMQASLEKTVENSSTAFEARAAEASRKVASELDHYSRSYVEHAQRQMDEAAGEIAARQQQHLKNTSEVVSAAFQDDLHVNASNTLSELADAAADSKRQILGELSSSSEASLTQFQEALDKSVAKGLVNAGSALEAQLAPLMEGWKSQREEEQRAWVEQVKGASDESIEHYKTRLENASNSWLLASATSLGRHSQAVIDALAQTAEQRLRDTCAQVLNSMGDAIRQRLMGLSSEFVPGGAGSVGGAGSASNVAGGAPIETNEGGASPMGSGQESSEKE